MKKQELVLDYYRYTIPSWAVCPIEYGDEVTFRSSNDFHNLGDNCVDCKVYFTTLVEV